jgi:hypothetical protein
MLSKRKYLYWVKNQTFKYQHMWTKMVDNFEDSNGYCIWALFPIILINCLFKILEFSIKIQLVDFRLFYGFWGVLMKYTPVRPLPKIRFAFWAGIH